MNTNRTDIHRPSLADPADYRFMAAFYQGGSDEMMMSYMQDMKEYDAALAAHPTFKGNHAEKFTCDHCGAAFAHGALFLHVPTGELVHIGHICADNTIGLPSKAARARKAAEKFAREEKIRREREAEYRKENSDVADWLIAYGVEVKDTNRRPHAFLDDMLRSFHKWGSLFPRQTEAVRKFMVNESKPKPVEAEPTTPLIEGRRTITGTILMARSQDSQFGTQYKMLVKEDDHNKVWGTIAESMFSEGHDLDGMKGLRVEFTATVERSRDDEHFGFYKRPSKMTSDNAKEVAAA